MDVSSLFQGNLRGVLIALLEVSFKDVSNKDFQGMFTVMRLLRFFKSCSVFDSLF